ncbi:MULTISPECIES: alpha/beta hydrolase [unclassified Streptomyces]|uniref:alpha/beta hydrolase n=1 Tax=unclassified Streptomyces TaxID=2593676 RepID=UPI00324BC16B
MSDTTSRSTGQAPTRMNLRPDLAALVEGIPYLDVRDPQAARATLKELEAQWEPADTSAITVAEQLIPGPEGAPDVVVRVYSPKAPGPHGGLLWIHGGGFVMGSLETEHNQCVWFASQAKCVVVSVQYRLAPEHPFPAGAEDCYAALRWLAAQAGELGVVPGRLGVAGCSAGGALAAAVALMARDRQGPELALQLLTFPVTDDRMDTPSARRFHDTPVWSTPQSEAMWRHYLGEGHEQRETSPYAAPNRAATLAELPPAHIVTAEYDPLRDEGIRYGQRLLEAGVPVTLHQWSGAFHIFDSFGTATGERSIAELVHAVREHLGD